MMTEPRFVLLPREVDGSAEEPSPLLALSALRVAVLCWSTFGERWEWKGSRGGKGRAHVGCEIHCSYMRLRSWITIYRQPLTSLTHLLEIHPAGKQRWQQIPPRPTRTFRAGIRAQDRGECHKLFTDRKGLSHAILPPPSLPAPRGNKQAVIILAALPASFGSPARSGCRAAVRRRWPRPSCMSAGPGRSPPHRRCPRGQMEPLPV